MIILYNFYCILLNALYYIYLSISRLNHILTEIPENLVLLEAHLKRPVRTHNILKRKLDIAKKVKQGTSNIALNNTTNVPEIDAQFVLYDQNNSPVEKNDVQEKLQNMVITEKSEEFSLDHCYLEGIDLTLADMIVFPCVHYLLVCNSSLIYVFFFVRVTYKF